MRFYEFNNEPTHLQENILSRAIGWIKKQLSSLFSSLKFGETKTVSIQIPPLDIPANEDAAGPQVRVSAVGFYHEWLIMKHLRDHYAAKQMTNPTIIFPQGSVIDEKVNSLRARYLEEIPLTQPKDADKFAAAVQRAEDSAPQLADHMIYDLESGEDFKLVEIISIEHSGADGSAKGTQNEGGKADIRITAKKKTTGETMVLLNASIKIACDGFVTLLTTGTAALVNKLFFPNENWGEADEAMENLYSKIQSIPELNSKYEQVKNAEVGRAALSALKAQAREQGDKARKEEITQEMIPFINTIGDLVYDYLFNHVYPAHKEEINQNFLIALGLDSADDVYYTLIKNQTKKQPERQFYLSSRTSEAYKKLYGNLKKNFTIVFGKAKAGRGKPNAVRTITLLDAEGKPFWDSKINFQQSGRGTWKVMMADLGKGIEKIEKGERARSAEFRR